MKTIQIIWQDIRAGRNLDIYLAIVLALIVAVLGIVGTANLTLVVSAVLATLALVSNGLLVNRRENEEIRNTLSSISSTKNLSNRFLKREYDRFGLRHILQNSHIAFLWGPYLTTHIQMLRDVIEEHLEDGLQVRFLLIEPSSAAASLSASSRNDPNTEEVDREIERNLMRLKKLYEKRPSGKLEARVLNYLPPFTIVAFDPHLPSGRMFVRLNCFHIPNETRPTFELTRKEDSEWFSFFVEQFESAWIEAHEHVMEIKT